MTTSDAKDLLTSQLEFINELVMDDGRNEAMYVYSLDAIEQMRYDNFETIRVHLNALQRMLSEKQREIVIARRLVAFISTGKETPVYEYAA
ncbi:MAG: hypothetical protein WAV21_01990 [Minisyncoccia bacterium]